MINDATLEALERLRPIAGGAGLSMFRIYDAIRQRGVEVAPRWRRDSKRGGEG